MRCSSWSSKLRFCLWNSSALSSVSRRTFRNSSSSDRSRSVSLRASARFLVASASNAAIRSASSFFSLSWRSRCSDCSRSKPLLRPATSSVCFLRSSSRAAACAARSRSAASLLDWPTSLSRRLSSSACSSIRLRRASSSSACVAMVACEPLSSCRVSRRTSSFLRSCFSNSSRCRPSCSSSVRSEAAWACAAASCSRSLASSAARSATSVSRACTRPFSAPMSSSSFRRRASAAASRSPTSEAAWRWSSACAFLSAASSASRVAFSAERRSRSRPRPRRASSALSSAAVARSSSSALRRKASAAATALS
mmetsp:Transcript_34099/g.99006  ORF Transcript_34099/g.99006 Transcript_34099/m.99006 type:complete len:310 (-) Transcript_34099:241-1170(-)